MFLYKDADECPICFLSYPPYLNHTRCCGQEICSECFVQIKRADPHYPEGHGENSDNPSPEPQSEDQPSGQLISEPACCPFCQQSELGVTYDPPPFRRGLVHSSGSLASGIGAMGAAMSSNSSINSAMSPTSFASPNNGSPPTAGGGAVTPVSRRRAQSLSATAPNVVTTDRVRPDWATKLASQSAHVARRAAAATALHTAAFLMGNQDNRPFRVGRFSRRNTSTNNVAGDASPTQNGGDAVADAGDGSSNMEPGPRSSSGRVVVGVPGGRRTRMEDLEELMFREALRQSLATEDDRRRKEEKEDRKEAKRREKEERKAAKAMAKRQGGSSSLYTTGTDSGHSSASASSLSLSGLGSNLGSGLGISSRRRGNSGASNLRVEASVANAMAVSGSGGGANGSGTNTGAAGSPVSSGGTSPVLSGDGSGPTSPVQNSTVISQNNNSGNGNGKGKGVDRGLASTPETDADTDAPSTSSTTTATSATSAPRLIPTSQPSAGPSHLRQMSSASSVSSSLPDSAAGSFPNPLHLQDPRASGLSLGSRSAASDDADHSDDRDPSTSSEPLFNFGSLAAVVGVQIEGRNAGRRLSVIGREEQGELGGYVDDTDIATGSSLPKQTEVEANHAEHVEHNNVLLSLPDTTASDPLADSQSTVKQPVPGINSDDDFKQPPEVLITPGTPAPTDEFD